MGDNQPVSTSHIKRLREAIEQTLPDGVALPAKKVALRTAGTYARFYCDLRKTVPNQLSSAEIRRRLRKGQRLCSELGAWMTEAKGNVLRDLVDSARQQVEKDPRFRFNSSRMWQLEIDNLKGLGDLVAAAGSLVPSDRSRPENFPLKHFVDDLSKVWERATGLTFTNSTKGHERPRDFAIAVCRAIDPALRETEINSAIRFAVKKTPGQRRGRKSQS